MITSPKGEVYPYVDEVKEYLQAGTGADVGGYAPGVSVAQSSVKLTWECDSERVTQYVVEYATKSDYSAVTVTASAKGVMKSTISSSGMKPSVLSPVIVP